MVYCFSCGETLVPGGGCATCREIGPALARPVSERGTVPGRPILTLVKTFPRLAPIDSPPHAA